MPREQFAWGEIREIVSGAPYRPAKFVTVEKLGVEAFRRDVGGIRCRAEQFLEDDPSFGSAEVVGKGGIRDRPGQPQYTVDRRIGWVRAQ
ncbi:hypothetical protein A4R44_03496 [Amycolatopsis sp. M39]|nr:hypothetical protein A4R44_03496 [Amycolatopsis sp. M39]